MPTYRKRGERHQAIVRVKHKGVMIHDESRTFDTEKEAISWGERTEKAVKVNGPMVRKTTKMTLGKLLLDHLDALRAHKTVPRSREYSLMTLGTDRLLASVPVNELTPVLFSQFATRRRAEGAGGATVLWDLALIRATLNAAKPMYGIDVNGECVSDAIKALTQHGVVNKSATRERRPTPDELARLAAEFDRISLFPSTVLPMRTIIELAVVFPRRLGELLDMRWEDYDKKKNTIILRDTKHPTKIRNEVVPVPAEAGRILATLPVIDERILPYNTDSASAGFQRACLRLGIKDLHFHDLRHEGISRLFEQGLAIQEVAIMSGHQSWAMLRRYTHPSVDALSEKLNRASQQTT